MNLEVEDWTSRLTRTLDRGFVLTIDYVSRAEINCTSRAAGKERTVKGETYTSYAVKYSLSVA